MNKIKSLSLIEICVYCLLAFNLAFAFSSIHGSISLIVSIIAFVFMKFFDLSFSKSEDIKNLELKINEFDKRLEEYSSTNVQISKQSEEIKKIISNNSLLSAFKK